LTSFVTHRPTEDGATPLLFLEPGKDVPEFKYQAGGKTDLGRGIDEKRKL
jgi:hypothetical protein